MATRVSLAVILNIGGHPLDLYALRDIPQGRVVRAELAEGQLAACLTATVHHRCDYLEFRAQAVAWARERGWQMTVAPLPGAS